MKGRLIATVATLAAALALSSGVFVLARSRRDVRQ